MVCLRRRAAAFASPCTLLLVLQTVTQLSAAFAPPQFFHPSLQSSSSSSSSSTSRLFGQVQRGDARGAALLLENVAVSRGSNPILTNIDWRVEPSQSWAIVGANGCGKSTLLKALVGDLALDDGTMLIANKLKVGYLQQTAVSGSNKTIYEEAASAMTEIQEARAAPGESTSCSCQLGFC
ncbi:ABC transporter [Fragilaria crotonensis]|nr:ABC transporter [Fragilaria crotonensis]